jgi:hypothetical protein
MSNPVTARDVETRWHPLSDAERDLAKHLLVDAWAILLARVPTLESRLGASPPTLSKALVVTVETAMVLRVMRNPEGKRQESIDDYSWTRDNAVSAGLLYLGDDELALLVPSGDLSGAFSITPYGPTYVAQAGPPYPPFWDVNP